MGLCLVSAITQQCNGNPIAFLERLKEALQKFTNLDLDSYKRQVILKDKFLSQCASDIRIKLQQLQQQGPAAFVNEVVQTATNTFYNREQEKEAKAQEKERKKDKACPDAGCPPGKPYSRPQTPTDKARGKCLICRQEGHPAKECPNRDKSPRTACHKCHQLGHWVALCPQDSKVSRLSTKPSLTMVQQD